MDLKGRKRVSEKPAARYGDHNSSQDGRNTNSSNNTGQNRASTKRRQRQERNVLMKILIAFILFVITVTMCLFFFFRMESDNQSSVKENVTALELKMETREFNTVVNQRLTTLTSFGAPVN